MLLKLCCRYITNGYKTYKYPILNICRGIFRPQEIFPNTIYYFLLFQIVVNALMLSIPSIINVILVCLIFWLIFSIMGVQFFAGKFFKCVDSAGDKFDPSVIANKTHCLSSGYNWTNSKVNFDHVGQGFLALFQVVSIRQ